MNQYYEGYHQVEWTGLDVYDLNNLRDQDNEETPSKIPSKIPTPVLPQSQYESPTITPVM